jgi:hypothetical protein
MAARDQDEGWVWFEQSGRPTEPSVDLREAALTCLNSASGQLLLAHLRRLFLDRRLAPASTDAELRHVEGQRSVVAYLLALLERARDRQEDRF